jgi:UDP-N-acetylmuramate-alanine ligase
LINGLIFVALEFFLKSLGYLFLSLPLSVITLSSPETWHFSPYISLDAQYAMIKVDEDQFHPVNGRLRIGSYFYETVGIEFTYGGLSISEETQHDLSVRLQDSMMLNFRWESPGKHNRGLSAYILTGYIHNELLIENEEGYPGLQNYSGINLGFGFKQTHSKWLAFYCEYNHQYFEQNPRIRGFSIGMQVNF